MIIDNTNNWRTPVRSIKARVELYNGSTLLNTYTAQDAIKSFTIDRVGEGSKFFGFGICQKATINLVDKNRVIEITTDNSFKNYINAGGEYISAFPAFYITEIKRDENTNELNITAYDRLYNAVEHNFLELELVPPYTIKGVAEAIAAFLGISGIELINTDDQFNIAYPDGANFGGEETLREVLNAIAEATQTIYFIDKNEKLVFKRLDKDGAALLEITREDYIELKCKTNRTLAAIVSATELGDNVGAELEINGSTQYVRDNPFWDIQSNVAELVENALAAVGGLSISQFDCSWRGNAATEIGDKIALTTKDNNTALSFVLNDAITFNGGLSQKTEWSYEDSGETESNPTTLGDALKKTFARVDKANKQIEIVAGETATIKLTTDAITSNVVKLDDDMAEVIAEVNTKVSAEDINFTIQKALEGGTERVTTATGYTFNEAGLHISKNNSEMSTSITEDGMSVYRDGSEVLKADNLGVQAEDLHATTFLIIGNNSRLENYSSGRTGCFWIGR